MKTKVEKFNGWNRSHAIYVQGSHRILVLLSIKDGQIQSNFWVTNGVWEKTTNDLSVALMWLEE